MEAASESQLTVPRTDLCLPRMRAGCRRSGSAAGLALRLWMLRKFFEVNGDTLIYGGLAKNLLLHGRYALTGGRRDLIPR